MVYEDGEAAIAFLQREGVPAKHISLWGWSLGSGVAAEMAYRGHGSALALLSPFTSVIDMGQKLVPFLPSSLIIKHRFDTLSKAPRIEQPTLIVHGDSDELIPVAMGEKLAAAIPHARMIRVEGGHHADFLDSDNSKTRPSSRELFDLLAEHLSSRP
jgi:pimeloyl-ACP methyl ester carboxylesterase